MQLFPEYILNELFPKMIAKRIAPERIDGKLVVHYLTVGTVYMRSYAYLKWLGMVFTFFFIIYFVIVNVILVSRHSRYFVTAIIIVNTVIFFNLFSNMFSTMGIVPQLIFPIVLSFKDALERRIKLKH